MGFVKQGKNEALLGFVMLGLKDQHLVELGDRFGESFGPKEGVAVRIVKLGAPRHEAGRLQAGVDGILHLPQIGVAEPQALPGKRIVGIFLGDLTEGLGGLLEVGFGEEAA